jgi:hypothetical protein
MLHVPPHEPLSGRWLRDDGRWRIHNLDIPGFRQLWYFPPWCTQRMSSSNRNGGDIPENDTVLASDSYDRSSDVRLSTAVLGVLDTLPRFDVESTDDLLASRIDPDALDALFTTVDGLPRDQGKVVFPIGSYEVTVTASDDILVRDRD